MIKNMFPTVVESTVIIIAAVTLSIILIYYVTKLKDSYYNRPSVRVSYVTHMIDLLEKNKNSDPSLKANVFSTISNLTEKRNKILINDIYKARLERLRQQRYWSEQKRCSDIWSFFLELRRDNDQTFKMIADISGTIDSNISEHDCCCGHGNNHHHHHRHPSQNPNDVSDMMLSQRRSIHVERYMLIEDIEEDALKEIARRALGAKDSDSGEWFGLVLGWATAANAMVEEAKTAVEQTIRGGGSSFAAMFLIQEQAFTEKKVEALNVVSEALKSSEKDLDAVMEKFSKVIEYTPTSADVAKEYKKLSKKLL